MTQWYKGMFWMMEIFLYNDCTASHMTRLSRQNSLNHALVKFCYRKIELSVEMTKEFEMLNVF